MHISKNLSASAATFAALAAAVALLTGCKHHNAINFVTNTEFGVKVGVNAEKIPEVKIGYSRQEAARVPVYLMNGQEATRTPIDVNSTLDQASEQLAKANAASTADDRITHTKAAQQLIGAAIQANDSSGTNRTDSLILPQIKKLAGELSTDAKAAAQPDKIETIRGLISAERARPQFFAEFQEAGKFIGTRDGKNAQDAYSVIGTFKGSATGKSNATGAGAEANMGIAQYFATGIAAQLLAETGGAALVSTSPNAKSPLIETAAMPESGDVESVAKHFASKPANSSERKAEFDKAFKAPLKPQSDEYDKYFKDKSEKEIQERLETQWKLRIKAIKKNLGI